MANTRELPIDLKSKMPQGKNSIAPGAPGRGHRQSRRFDDLLARGGQAGQRQNRSRFAGSIGSIKCFSCATAELAAARKRTTSRQKTARISNYTPLGL